MAFTFKHALEFNSFTVGLATAGLAYAATIGTEIVPVGAQPISTVIKFISTLTILAFSIAILVGVGVMGRASKLTAKDEDRVSDQMMSKLGQAHSVALVLGLLFSGFLMLNKIWGWF